MKFVCSKTILNQIVNVVQKSIGAKSSHPIIECIKIDAQSDGHVTFTTNSMELCIEYNADMTVYESGSVALPSKIFGEIVRRLPEGEVEITIDPKNYVTDIECEQSKFNIQGMSSTEFPDVPIVDEQYQTEISQKDLKQIIRKVFPFISQVETRKPVLTGALFDFRGSELNVVGTDSHRLAVIKTPAADIGISKKFVIPGSTLSKISQVLSDEEEMIKMIVSDKNILFDFGVFQVYSRLLEGEFLKYDVILSATNSIRVKADKQRIINSLERANLIINDDLSSKTENKMPVKLSIAYNKIDISCKTVKSYVNDSVEVEHEGGDIVIGFNCRFMLDALNACDEENILMEFSAPTSGCFIKPEDGSNRYTYMVLPVRLYN
ncbi:MAG: DNA polymerase III subunit beta [Clostridiales bacterium]|nr:DNA polymerase III subunit beta [Clostridiales bacterium]